MDSLQDLLQKKASNLSDDTKSDLTIAQQEIDRIFKTGVNVSQIKEGTVFLDTQSSPMASELRLQQVELVQILNSSMKTEVTTLRIRIR